MTQQRFNRIPFACFLQILLVCTLWCNPVSVRSQPVIPKPAAQLITSFPFTLLTGGVIILNARIGNYPDTLNFILDTGSGGISLDSATVAYFNLTTSPSERTIRGIAGVRKVSFVLNQTLQLPGLEVPHLDFHINDYDLLSSVYGVRIDGIIGYSFLNRYLVKINYDNLKVEVWTPGTIKYPKNGHLLKPALNNIPVTSAEIRDARSANARFFFDTGAGLCILMSEEFLRDSAFLKTRKKIINTQGEGLGGKKLMRLTTVKEVKIGPYKFRSVPAHFFEDEFKLTSYPYLGGLLGNDLLRRFNLILNYSDKEIHISPNTHFFDHFDYSYTGFSFYLVDGEILVEDVVPDSPADKAGILPGDIIVAVNNNFNNNIQAYKLMMQVPNARIRMIVKRGSELKLLFLKVQSIL